MANGKTSHAAAGSSPGLTNPSFFTFFLQIFAILREKTREKTRENVLKRFCVHFNMK